MSAQRVAVLGAGIQGVCAALELARRGCDVHLFEQAEEPIGGASLWNEGKLHLGFVFANDGAARTARTLMLGSLRFAGGLRRWGIDGIDALCSRPFVYAMHRRSLLDAAAIEAHFSAVAAQHAALRQQRGATYPGGDCAAACVPLTKAEVRRAFDDAHVAGAWRTVERSIQPQALAARLREAVAAAPRIRFRGRTRVHRVERLAQDRLGVAAAGAGAESDRAEAFDSVVNALWADRLRIDATLGLQAARRWLFRFKLSVHLRDRRLAQPPPSTTLLLGPFGDVVDFGDGRLYLSWYPTCKLAASDAVAPPDWSAGVSAAARRDVLERTVAALSAIVPAVGGIDLARAKIAVDGGVIFSWGGSDITDLSSEIHQRFDIGVHSTGAYHSIDTGKYCMAPAFAVCVGERICPQ